MRPPRLQKDKKRRVTGAPASFIMAVERKQYTNRLIDMVVRIHLSSDRMSCYCCAPDGISNPPRYNLTVEAPARSPLTARPREEWYRESLRMCESCLKSVFIAKLSDTQIKSLIVTNRCDKNVTTLLVERLQQMANEQRLLFPERGENESKTV